MLLATPPGDSAPRGDQPGQDTLESDWPWGAVFPETKASRPVGSRTYKAGTTFRRRRVGGRETARSEIQK